MNWFTNTKIKKLMLNRHGYWCKRVVHVNKLLIFFLISESLNSHQFLSWIFKESFHSETRKRKSDRFIFSMRGGFSSWASFYYFILIILFISFILSMFNEFDLLFRDFIDFSSVRGISCCSGENLYLLTPSS